MGLQKHSSILRRLFNGSVELYAFMTVFVRRRIYLTLVTTTMTGIPKFCVRVDSPRGNSTFSSSVLLDEGWRGFTSLLIPVGAAWPSSGSVYSWKNRTTEKKRQCTRNWTQENANYSTTTQEHMNSIQMNWHLKCIVCILCTCMYVLFLRGFQSHDGREWIGESTFTVSSTWSSMLSCTHLPPD